MRREDTRLTPLPASIDINQGITNFDPRRTRPSRDSVAMIASEFVRLGLLALACLYVYPALRWSSPKARRWLVVGILSLEVALAIVS